jgi:hypothetical protein
MSVDKTEEEIISITEEFTKAWKQLDSLTFNDLWKLREMFELKKPFNVQSNDHETVYWITFESTEDKSEFD